jgi:type IV pilus assembly protein PilC
MAREKRTESERGPSLKDEIISRIRAQEERERQTAPVEPVLTERRTTGRVYRRAWFGPGIHEMAVYCRQLATLIDVGIPLLRSLQILAQRSATKKLRDVSVDLARRVEEGQPLSTAMLAHQNVFSPMFIGIVRSGEAGGILEDALRRLADILERRANIRRRITGAMVYPLIAFFLEIVVIAIIVMFALPRLMSAYPRRDLLPLPTQYLLNASEWFAAYWVLALIVFVLLIVGTYLILQMTAGRMVWQRTLLYVPLFGDVARKINVARFTRTLGNLTAAGIPLADALAITAETSENAVVERALRRVHANVERGGKMEEPMRKEPIFDEVVVDMIMVGDEAGTLDAMLLKIADTYENDVDASLRTMTSILEPLLIVFLGIAVAFIAIAIFLPYVGLIRNPQLMVE